MTAAEHIRAILARTPRLTASDLLTRAQDASGLDFHALLEGFQQLRDAGETDFDIEFQADGTATVRFWLRRRAA